MYLYSWNPNSEGAKLLAEQMNIRKIRHEKSTFKGSPKKTVINWGSGKLPPEVLLCNVLNSTAGVNRVSDKLKFFNTAAGKCSIPDFTTDIATAIRWISEGNTVCARTVLNGHSAEGLVILDKKSKGSDIIEAPLYTKYIPKKDEYRVHVVHGEVIDIQRKALRPEFLEETGRENVNYRIRNLDNGFIYVRNNVNPPVSVTEEAIKGITASGLDFGACDLVFNEKKNQAYLLEINSAPGVQGLTVEAYSRAFQNLLKIT